MKYLEKVMNEIQKPTVVLPDPKDTAVDEILSNMVTKSAHQQILEHNEENKSWEDIDYYIQTANARILLEKLAPEVTKNEETKRVHKGKLIQYVSIFLGVQFAIIFILVMTIIVSIVVFHALNNDLSKDVLNMLFAFFGTYITSVIVELICILKYIVVNVFDTSLSALMEAFKLKTENESDKEQKQ